MLVFLAPLVLALPLPAQNDGRQRSGVDAFRPADGQWEHETGVLGTVFPQPSDVLLDDVMVHQDDVGGASQTLAALAAHPDGFVAAWYDSRHGNIGLFLGRVDSRGERVGEEEPIHAPRTSRQMEPRIGAGPGIGAVAWFATEEGELAASLRFLTPESGMIGPRHTFGSSAGGGGRGGAGGPSRAPGLCFDEDGSGLAAWVHDGRVLVRRLGRGLALVGEPVPLEARGEPALGDVHVAIQRGGRYAVAWSTAGGVGVWVRGGEPATGVVPGRVVGFAADAGGGGWWLLAREGELARLHRIDAEGRLQPATLPPILGRAVSTSFAVGAMGPLVVVEREAPGGIELYVTDPAARQWSAPLPLVGPDGRGARGPRIAAHGSRALVAWTDLRHGDPDVYYRVLGPTGFEGPERRWNTDAASADQTNPAVGSDGVERAVVVWEDRRFGASVLFGRRLSPTALVGDEFVVGDRRAAGESGAPMVAMGRDGGFALLWKQREPGRVRVLARTYDAENRPRGATLELGQGGHPAFRPGLVALADGGYAAIYDAAPSPGGPVALLSARITPRGTLAGAPVVVSDGPHAPRAPHLVVLADARLLAVWDEHAPGRPPAHFGRFLGPAGRPHGERIVFPASEHRIGDIDPAAAPTADGGFFLTWTGNESPTRDVYVQRFDREGRPAARPLPVSVRANEQDFPEVLALADGTHVVLWEDDISYFDHIHARRILADGTLGPSVTVNQRPTRFVEDRTALHAAPLGGGFVTAWSDRRRGLGHDVYLRVVGPHFDRDLEPVTMIRPGE